MREEFFIERQGKRFVLYAGLYGARGRGCERSGGGVRGEARRRGSLRPDTTVAPAGSPEDEVYVRELTLCCLRSLKREARAEPSAEPVADKRLLELGCSCGRSWRITSSLDDRGLGRFVTHGGPRVGGTHPAA